MADRVKLRAECRNATNRLTPDLRGTSKHLGLCVFDVTAAVRQDVIWAEYHFAGLRFQ